MSEQTQTSEYPTYACGHTARRRSARTARIAPFSFCPECRAEHGPFEIAKLPALTGSDKRIAWAQAIRREWAAKADDLAYLTIAELIATQTSAAWWIDHRAATMTALELFALTIPAPV